MSHALRTVRQIPREAAGRIRATVQRVVMARESSLLPVVSQLLDATDHSARARILLRLPDAILLTGSPELGRACSAAGFELGAQYIANQVIALHAVRTPKGDLPDHVVQTMQIWRNGLLAVTGGQL